MDCMSFIISICFVQVSYRPRGFGCLLSQCQWCAPLSLDPPPAQTPKPKPAPTPPRSLKRRTHMYTWKYQTAYSAFLATPPPLHPTPLGRTLALGEKLIDASSAAPVCVNVL